MDANNRYHFAYADNMNEENARRICPGAKFEGIGELPGYRLTFTPHGRATLSPDGNATVWGVVWCLSNRDIFNLERNEEEHLPDYRRQAVQIILSDGRQLEAFCYISLVTGKPQINPSLLAAMIDSAEYWSLPDKHIKMLQDLLRQST